MYNRLKSMSFKYLRNLSNRTDIESIKKSLDPKNNYIHKNKSPTFSGPIEFKKINLFIGQNGSGKSTVIDSIRALSNKNLLPSIPRYITNDSVKPWLKFQFDDKSYISFTFPLLEDINVIERVEMGGVTEGKMTNVCIKPGEINYTESGGFNFPVFNSTRIKYWDGLHSLDEVPKNINDVFSIMNESSSLFLGVGGEMLGVPNVNSACFEVKDDCRVIVYCSDDAIFQNELEYRYIPHGWRRIISLISFVLESSEWDILLIEEPEGHLHPKLQRFIIKVIEKYSVENELQVFISTHSPSIINNANLVDNTKIFHAKGHVIEEIPILTNDVLSDLGVKASDILQTNGIVWVEGPSDKVYLTAWLDHYADITDLPRIKFGDECEFLYYGGALLSHYGENNKELISAMTVNKNGIFVMDKDLDGDIKKFPKTTKAKIQKTYKKLDCFYSWVTCQYTIESYLPEEFRKQYFEMKNKKLQKINTIPKVKIAKKFIESKELISSSYKENPGLQLHLKKMYELIKKWNS
ncbi:AAA family ATPase [Vibrio fluvialis]|uniref:ATP-dependent nuclease n=1 Tax=Vibrio fluvialis TaxID=676 RepID=UPI00192B3966|nr:ATP-binding protein [Vibrio fluvialis]MBL4279820.1 AAA family ATPase [Vibrio fluvialis]